MGAKHIGAFRGIDDTQLWTHAFGPNAASHAAIEEAQLFEVNGVRLVEVLLKETGSSENLNPTTFATTRTLAIERVLVGCGTIMPSRA